MRNGQEIPHSNHKQISHSLDGTVSLSLSSLSPSDTGEYAVRASNEAGEAKSTCKLMVVSTASPPPKEPLVKPMPAKPVGMPPTFSKYLDDFRVPKGHEAKFECTVSGVPKPKVQWCFRGWPISSDPSHLITESGDDHRLVIPEAKTQHTGRYSLSADNESGKAVSAATLLVDDVFEDNVVTVEGFSEQRAHAMVMSRKSTKIQMSSLSRVSEQFSENGICEVHKETSSEQHVRSQLGTLQTTEPYSLQTTETHEMNQGFLEFVPLSLPSILSGEQDHTSQQAPKFTKPLESTLVREGDRICLEGTVTGDPEPSIQWFKSEKELFSNAHHIISNSGERVSLNISKSSETDSGYYSCKASNKAGSATSSAEVAVKPIRIAPKFVKRLNATVVKSGQRVELQVEVEGIPEPEVRWFKNGTELRNNPDFRIKKEGTRYTATIPEAFPEDSGRLTAKATNPAGEAQSIADLVVEELASPPEIAYKEYSVVEQKHEVSFPVFCRWDYK